MRLAALAVATLLVVSPASAQVRTDFSGVWQLDLARSDAAAHTTSPGPVTLEITQSAAEIRMVTTTRNGQTTVTYALARPESPSLASTTGTPTARWQDDALLTDAIRDVRGQSVTVAQSRRVSPDGNEMIVDSIVNVQHGYSLAGAQTYGASRDVFVRVRR